MVLHGWKQIAHYLGCGIRTAQRWEAQCALPVNRPRNHMRSPVLAQSEALDSWAAGGAPAGTAPWDDRCRELQDQILELKRELAALTGRVPGIDLRVAKAQQDPAAAVANRQRPIGSQGAGF